jgi:hypothetical protein
MLKKLLYLYNDGHNPFPKLGKGGLGYHLPQYKKKIHGGAVSYNEDGTMNYDANDENFLVFDPIGNIIGTYRKKGSHELSIYNFETDMEHDTDIPDINTTNIEDNHDPEMYYINSDYSRIPRKFELDEDDEEDKPKYEELSDNEFKHIDTLKTLRGKINYINKLLNKKLDPSIIKLLNEYKEEFTDELEEENKQNDKKTKYHVDIPKYNDEQVTNKDVDERINKDLNTEVIDENYNKMVPNIDKIYTEKKLPNFYELFTDGQHLIDDDGNIVLNDKGTKQNLYESGKDLEAMILNNPELLNTVIRQIYGNDVEVKSIKSDSKMKEDPAHKGKFTNYDAYTVLLEKKGGTSFNVSIEMKKYDNYFDIVENLIKPSKEDYKKFISTELNNEGLLGIQENLNKIKRDYDNGILTKEEYKEKRKPYNDQKKDLYSKVITPLSGKQNIKFSFNSKIGLPMKYTKVPLYKNTEEDHPYHSKELVSNISSLQANPHKTKKQAVIDTTNAVSGDNDILFLVLVKGALLAQSYKKYLEKFDETHIANTAQFTTGPYVHVPKGATKGSVDHYNINFHNMQIIDTLNVPKIDDKILKTMRKNQRIERLKRFKQGISIIV